MQDGEAASTAASCTPGSGRGGELHLQPLAAVAVAAPSACEAASCCSDCVASCCLLLPGAAGNCSPGAAKLGGGDCGSEGGVGSEGSDFSSWCGESGAAATEDGSDACWAGSEAGWELLDGRGGSGDGGSDSGAAAGRCGS